MEKNARSSAPGPLPDDQSRSLLALHIAEYEALMTRNTYLMALQFALWPAVGLILTLGATLWASERIHIDGGLLIWIAIGGLYVVANNWADTLWELYNNVSYMEHELRNKVSADLGVHGFWGYERYLATQRSLTAAPWELATPAFGTVVILLMAVRAPPSSGWQYAISGFTVVFAIRMWARCLDALRLRRHFTDKVLQVSSASSGTAEYDRWMIAGITIAVGILPLSLIAYWTRTIWFSSAVDSPLAAVPSVWLGDTVILPILNYRIGRFLRDFFAEGGPGARRVFRRSFIDRPLRFYSDRQLYTLRVDPGSVPWFHRHDVGISVGCWLVASWLHCARDGLGVHVPFSMAQNRQGRRANRGVPSR